MNTSRSRGLAACAVLLLIALIVFPVSGAVAASAEPAVPAATLTTAALASAAATPAKPFISAMANPANPAVGSPVTISGVASGANLTAGVQIWIFAGNYVNVSTVPVNADGTFSKTYDSTGLPAATYYVFAQSPGPDGMFGITMQSSGTYSGQVVNARTGATIFTFTGTGSVQDAAAAAALSDAINKQGGDDVYTKLTFNLVPPAVATIKAADTAAPAASAAPVATKSPLPPEVTGISLVIGALAAVLITRK
ncbi:hypothetical protein [uncultured Methanoregula sp.]|uniref:hypothetical protein n=1 Tax=uncultured Methanoregula sp. TaxID=1005933 RepID=UPI002AAAD0EC|nr:hypothetical protein [uncultured Methanoregula sp.]